jgi:peroxiredoxin
VGKASRARDQREQQQKRQQQRNLWLATGGVVLAIVAMAAVLNRLNQAPSAPGPAKPTAADLNAPKSLRVAAAKVGFHPQLIPGVGKIEDKSASDSPAPNNTTLLKPGTVAPAFSLKTPQGDTVSLSDYAGKALLIEFFATSCPHCQAEAPHLRRLAMLDAHRYDFVSVNADSEDAPSVFAFHRYFGLPYPALVDRSGSLPGSFSSPGSAGKVAQAYGMEAFPTFYVIDRQGRVWWAGDSEQPDAKLQQELAAAAAHG